MRTTCRYDPYKPMNHRTETTALGIIYRHIPEIQIKGGAIFDAVVRVLSLSHHMKIGVISNDGYPETYISDVSKICSNSQNGNNMTWVPRGINIDTTFLKGY